MVNQRDSLLREVDAELRREQLLKIWNAYGTYFIIAAVMLIAGVGGYRFWQDRQLAAMQVAGSDFTAALAEADSGSLEKAQPALAPIIKSGNGGYAALAQLRLAGVMAHDGKVDDAIKTYDELAANTRADQILRDYARLQAATLMVGTADWTEVQNRLNDLMVDTNPWRYSAREVVGLAALKAQKLDDARQFLGPLVADPRVPQSVAEHARAAMAMLAEAELAAKAGPAPAPEAAPTMPEAPKAPPAENKSGQITTKPKN